jgi:flagellin-like hook-associated protein FlgL
MSRIATLAASTHLVDLMAKLQGRLQDRQVQVTTEKQAQSYSGIAAKAGRLVSLETTRTAIGRGIDDNAILQTRLEATDKAVEAMGKTMRDFRAVLLDLASNQPLDEAHVTEVQAWAFRAMKDMESYLNTELNGRFLFAGSRATTKPADLGLTTAAEFQARFDGEAVVYPPTRAAHVETSASLPPAVTGGLTMTGGDTITATNPGAFTNLAVGATITLANSGLGNDGSYTVVSTNGSDQITIAGTLSVGTATIPVTNGVNNGGDAGASLTVGNWYRGDTVAQSHHVDDARSFALGLDGVNPTFEKAIRAMGLIAQGSFGTAGGLEQNQERVDWALALLDSSLVRASGAGEPLGPEAAGNVETTRMDLGFDLAVLSETNERQRAFAVSLDNQVADIENVDPLEAMTRLLDDGRALEASYRVVAQIREFSLMNYL